MRVSHLLILSLSIVSKLYPLSSPLVKTGQEKLAEELPSPRVEVDGIVEGVNVVTGSYNDYEVDICTKGPEPLCIERSYFKNEDSPRRYLFPDAPNFLGWHLNYNYLLLADSKDESKLMVGELSGGMVRYVKKGSDYFFDLARGSRGVTNTGGALLSGQTNIKNNKIVKNPIAKGIDLTKGDGTLFCFQEVKGISPRFNNTLRKYFLKNMRKPSGQRVLYDYHIPSALYREIKTTNPSGSKVFNWLKIEQSGEGFSVTSSDGKVIRYCHTESISRAGSSVRLLDQVVKPDGSFIRYEYQTRPFKGITDFFVSKEKPEGRKFQVNYDIKEKKVSCLKAPVGAGSELVTTHTFKYLPQCTEVLDAKGEKTIYCFDENDRITSVEKWEKESVIFREENEWGTGKDETHLISKALKDGEGKLYLKRFFEYDERGNIVEERMCGDLKGTNTYDCYTKIYTYSDDGLNLLMSESDGIGKTTYKYKNGTNLLTEKLVFDGEKLALRQLREYDLDAILVKIIEDDGQDAFTERRVTKITPVPSGFGIGQSEMIENYYVDRLTKQEVMLSRRHLHYSAANEMIEEQHYDGGNNFCYSETYAYDPMGRVRTHVDLRGVTTFKYDLNGNLKGQEGPAPKWVVENEYDFSNRLILVKQSDGRSERTRRYLYDTRGFCYSEKDPSGNETRHEHDALGRVIKTIFCNGDVIQKAYDVAGNVRELIDERGDVTSITYNIRGEPTTVTRGDVVERFEYDLRGNLVKKVGANGGVTLYTYDFLDRLRKVEQEGRLIAHDYNAFHLIKTTDAEGLVTLYEYDGAGREIAVRRGTALSEKHYDASGRVDLIKEYYGDGGEDYTSKKIRYDMLGRVVEESVPGFETVGFDYDCYGNKSEVITDSGVTKTIYDGFQRIIEVIDGVGLSEKSYYSDMFPCQGGYVLEKKQIDAMGTITQTIYDRRGRVAHVIEKNVGGVEIANRRFDYDGVGNKCEERHKVYGREKECEVKHRFIYERDHRLIESIEDGVRHITYTYGNLGEIKRKETPGAVFTHEYDSFGLLKTQKVVSKKQSGERIHFSYDYDLNGALIEVQDLVKGRKTIRTYEEGRLVSETQESGLTLSYSHDRQGRRTLMTLPDGSEVKYAYRGPRLHEVRYGTYVHTYVTRDSEGRVKTAQLIGKAGWLEKEYDGKGRVSHIESEHWSERVLKYDDAGNIREKKTKDVQGEFESVFGYDALSQVTEESGSEPHRYAYDSLRNRLEKDGKKYVIGGCQSLLSDSEKTYTWGDSGELLTCGNEIECRYDALCRLIAFNEVHYTYDSFNRRLTKGHIKYLYDGDQEIGAFDSENHLIELRILGEGEGAEIGASVLIAIKGKTYAPIHDQRGNITTLIDAESGEVAESYRYTAYGEESGENCTGNPWRFSSKRVDEESGWVYFGRRYYAPKIGRWTTTDPLGFAEGPNFYAFLKNNPFTHFDFYGLSAQTLAQTRNCTECLEWGFKWAMRAVEWVGKNLIPLPGARDIVEAIGRWGAGGDLFKSPEYKVETNRIGYVEGKRVKGEMHYYINGLCTSFDEAMKQTREISRLHGGIEVILIYNASQGAAMGLIECILEKFGMLAPTDKMIHDVMTAALNQNPEMKIHVYAHSQGGLHLFNAGTLMDRSCREHIYANTLGSAKIIPEKMFRQTRNYVSMSDPVCMTDTFGYLKACFGKSDHVVFLSPSSNNFIKEHFFMNDTYLGQMRLNGENYVRAHPGEL